MLKRNSAIKIEDDKKMVEQFKRYAKDISILYVEDEKSIREATTQNILKKSFGMVYVAENGVEAVEIYKKTPADIILTDIDMPQMDGIELVKTIREIKQDQSIIVLSAHNESCYYIDLIQLGVDAFLLKPVEILNFMYTLSRVCKGIYESNELGRVKNELMQQQNRSIVMYKALQDGRSIEKHEMQVLAQKQVKITARKFCEEYPTDINIINDKLEVVDESLDILMAQFIASRDNYSRLSLSDALIKYANILAAIHEFANLSVAIESLAHIVGMIDIGNKSIYIRDILLGVSESIRAWRITVLEDRSATDISLVGASLINDCVQAEAYLLEGEIKNEEETVFF